MLISMQYEHIYQEAGGRRQEGALILGSDGGKALATDVLSQLIDKR
jgi:hypothetical protein